MCALPGSKSESNRALVLAALADAPSRLSGVLAARDTTLMVGALQALGVTITHNGDDLFVTPPKAFSPAASIDCGLAGNVMRFVPPIAALAPGKSTFVGDERASQRPMSPLVDALRQLGAQCSSDALPFTLSAPEQLTGHKVVIDASESSQFISALLLSGARLPHGIHLMHTGDALPSRPHIDMTVKMLRDRGVVVTCSEPTSWQVAPGPIAAIDQRIEPDLTNAAAFLVAGVLSGGSVAVPGWPEHTTQPGDLMRQVLDAMGAHTTWCDGVLTASYQGALHGVSIDLHAASELVPVVAAMGAVVSGRTVISGVAHIRGHETDRLAAIAAELSSIGVNATGTDNGLIIEGTDPARLHPTRVLRSYADHRLAHLAAVLGLVVDGIEVDDISAVSKTMPDFTERWAAMIGQV